MFSGIGNAYSDEILFHARLSPIALTQKLSSKEIERLFASTRSTLSEWVERFRAESITGSNSPPVLSGAHHPRRNVQEGMSRGQASGHARAPIAVIGGFPEKVTAFRPEMAVHGKYQQPCPRCGVKIQRIRYASNETNYCPNCQTGGKLLADRALSRLLRSDWPRNAEELEGLTSKQ
jgi:formamidopyrimidine-DNA glycosylase